jgi:hypothetical protein
VLSGRNALLALVSLLVVLAGGLARADVVHLRSGGQIEGKVLEETADAIRVRTRFGVQTIARSEVVKIERKETAEEVYARRLASLEPGDVEGLLDLARFCKEQRLTAEWKATLERVVAADPDNEEANRALGRERVDGRWMTGAEKAEHEKRKEIAAKRAQGLVEHRGAWVTREEKEALERGLVRYEGKWMSEAEMMEKKGYERVGGQWIRKDQKEAFAEAKQIEKLLGVSLVVETTEHFSVLSANSAENAKKVGGALERALDHVVNLLSVKEDLLQSRRMPVILLVERDHYTRYVDVFGEKHEFGPGWAKAVRTAAGFYHYQPCASVDYRASRVEDNLVNSSVHKLGHVLVNRLHFGYNYVPAWIDEGFAAYLERAVLDQNITFCLSSSYGQYTVGTYGTKETARGAKVSGNEPSLDEIIRKLVGSGTDRKLVELLPLDLPDLDYDATAKAWSVIEFLVREDAQQFDRFLRRMRDRLPKFERTVTARERAEIQVAVFQEVYGVGPDVIDSRWRRTVR